MGEIYDDQSSHSPIIPTRYAHHASQLIEKITKKMVLTIIFLCPLFFLAIIDALRLVGFRNIIGDQNLDNIIVIFSGCLLIVVIFLFRSLLNSRKVLKRWADLFERNSIIAGLNISMNKLNKEEALMAVAETIEEIGEPLQRFFSDTRDVNRFIDVARGMKNVFDILIDKDINGIPDDLRSVLKEYGAVIIKVESGMIDVDKVLLFSRLLSEYVKETKNDVGLPVIIGENISDAAYNFVNTSHDELIKRIVLVERPAVQSQID
ncbi:MAG: hypothetical protein ACM3JQ_06255 [Candidatus Eiseniibacteriota bacterium]|jgi:hypothetical protein|nr:hypothetical protein [Nitrososphaeraceae archaeon]